jgi:hypothetical protein
LPPLGAFERSERRRALAPKHGFGNVAGIAVGVKQPGHLFALLDEPVKKIPVLRDREMRPIRRQRALVFALIGRCIKHGEAERKSLPTKARAAASRR